MLTGPELINWWNHMRFGETQPTAVPNDNTRRAIFAGVVENILDIVWDKNTSLSFLELAFHLEGGTGDKIPPYIGPFQFAEAAWKEVGEGRFANAMDLELSARAALKYAFLNYRRLNRIIPGVEYTPAVAYLCHNQGAGGAAFAIRNGRLKWPKQSLAAVRLFKDNSLIA